MDASCALREPRRRGGTTRLPLRGLRGRPTSVSWRGRRIPPCARAGTMRLDDARRWFDFARRRRAGGLGRQQLKKWGQEGRTLEGFGGSGSDGSSSAGGGLRARSACRDAAPSTRMRKGGGARTKRGVRGLEQREVTEQAELAASKDDRTLGRRRTSRRGAKWRLSRVISGGTGPRLLSRGVGLSSPAVSRCRRRECGRTEGQAGGHGRC
jgi:hypothetical protein